MKVLLQRGTILVRSIDWWFVGAIAVQLAISLAIQYSFTINQGDGSLRDFYTHAAYIGLGLTLFVGASVVDYRAVRTHPAFPWAVGLLLLVGVLLFGTTIKGTTGWFVVGGFSAQPVEFVKLLLILALAAYFGQDPACAKNVRFLLTGAAATAILVLLVLIQPDLGSALILFSIWFGIMVVLRAPRWFTGLVIIGTILASIVGWFFLFEDYQKDRLTTFLDPAADPLGSGYNITQSMIAVGSGELWGRGLGLGTQSQLHFLPEATSDFVFAVVGEELGLIGVTALFLALLLILYRLWLGLRNTRDHFAFIFLLGVSIYLFVQSVMVIGMNIGVLPVTGVPLPLISAGGTSMFVTLLALGIAHSALMQSRSEKGHQNA